MTPKPVDNLLELERFRAYLRILAVGRVRRQALARIDPSDIVQQALLEAHRSRGQFRGGTEAELAGWLRTILAHTISNTLRAGHRAKRDIGRERSLEAALEASSVRMEDWLRADQSSPSQFVSKHEEVLRIADAMTRLPETQRDVLVLRYCEGLTVDEISEIVGKSAEAVGGLMRRGMRQLREWCQREQPD